KVRDGFGDLHGRVLRCWFVRRWRPLLVGRHDDRMHGAHHAGAGEPADQSPDDAANHHAGSQRLTCSRCGMSVARSSSLPRSSSAADITEGDQNMSQWNQTRWSDEAISTINELIETCKDGEQGFRMASDVVEDRELKELFLRYSQERRQFAAELQNAVRMAGGEPESRGSVSGVLHRGWMSVKSAFTGGGPGAVGNAAEASEHSAGAADPKAVRDEEAA